MNRQWIEARQTKYAAYVTMYILVILCIVSVANVLANRYNKSYDSTSNKRYSLSDQTAKIVKGLSQPVIITYFDKTSGFQTGKDLLDRYTTLSPKVHLDYVDPDKNPQAARAAGITKYGTTVVQIGAKKEEAKNMTEEDVTGAIIRDLKSNTRTVCFVTGGGERQIDDADRPGPFPPERFIEQGRLHVQIHQPARKSGSSRGLHGGRGRRPEKRLPAAGSRCDQEICGRWRARDVPAGPAAENRAAHRG